MIIVVFWVFYYKVIKVGDVFIVVLIDKGSVIVVLLMVVWIFNEVIMFVKLIGVVFIVVGLLVIFCG